MQQRTRRAHGLRARKISISVSRDDLRVLSSAARRKYGGNVSALVHAMIVTLQREEAMDDLLRSLDADRVSGAELQKLREEIAAAPTGRRKRRSAA
jgi:hypothetical protein